MYVCVYVDMFVCPLTFLFLHCVCDVFSVGSVCSVCNVYIVMHALNFMYAMYVIYLGCL